MPVLTPRLVVRDARAAQALYAQVFGGSVGPLLATPDGQVAHAEVTIGDVTFSLTEFDLAPVKEASSGILLHLECDDPDATAAALVEQGGEVLIPIADQFYGKREGRVRDPFGHAWILSREVEALSMEELERRTAAWGSEG
ncbi:MAG: VOC family protein [Myxococcota bacterium]